MGNNVETISDIENLIARKKDTALSINDRLKSLDVSAINNREPSDFAIRFINFIKLCNDTGEENISPPFHYEMLDRAFMPDGERKNRRRRILNVVFRGSGKTTIFVEYLIFYLAIFRELPTVKEVDSILIVMDSMDNGIVNLKKNMEERYKGSSFLKEYLPNTFFGKREFTLENKDGETFDCVLNGVKQGIRGTKRQKKRPKVAIFDDIFKDDDVYSEDILKKIANVMDKGVKYALHPTEHIIIWNNTVFLSDDPVSRAVKSGRWEVNLYPVCQKFPCDRKDFVGLWEERFTYDYLVEMYIDAKLSDTGVGGFLGEMMLDTSVNEMKIIDENKIKYIEDRELLLKNKDRYNFYITTDIAVSNKSDTDYAVIAVWAYTSVLDTWILVDLFMNDTVDMETYTEKLLYYVRKWNVEDVTFEVSGQQLGFVSMVENKMYSRNIIFRIIEVRPTGNKLQRFLNYGYRFNSGRIMLYAKDDIISDNGREVYDEIIKELTSVTKSKILSKHDDFLDAISQLQYHTPFDKSYGNILEEIEQTSKSKNRYKEEYLPDIFSLHQRDFYEENESYLGFNLYLPHTEQ